MPIDETSKNLCQFGGILMRFRQITTRSYYHCRRKIGNRLAIKTLRALAGIFGKVVDTDAVVLAHVLFELFFEGGEFFVAADIYFKDAALNAGTVAL